MDAHEVAQVYTPPTNEEERQAHFEEIQSMLERLEDVGLIDRA